MTAAARIIDDNDLCSDCQHCGYEPGALSTCTEGWPGETMSDGPRAGQVTFCNRYLALTIWGEPRPPASECHPDWSSW